MWHDDLQKYSRAMRVWEKYQLIEAWTNGKHFTPNFWYSLKYEIICIWLDFLFLHVPLLSLWWHIIGSDIM